MRILDIFMKMTAKEIIEGMKTLENPEQRKVLMRFFKTDKGQYVSS